MRDGETVSGCAGNAPSPAHTALLEKTGHNPVNLFRAAHELAASRPSIRSQTPGSGAGSADHGPTHETRLLSPLISSPISSSHLSSHLRAESGHPPGQNGFCMGRGFPLLLPCLVCSPTGRCFLPLGC